MFATLEDYLDIVGEKTIAELHKKARRLYGKHIIQLNATFIGGGVAEILSRLIPLMNDVGVNTGWRVLHGNPTFYDFTKKLHNALQGASVPFSDEELSLYGEVNKEFSTYTHIHHDCVVIHDPQPLPLIAYCRKQQPWIWRCHIDVTAPDKIAWDVIKKFIFRYDIVVVSSKEYIKSDLPVEQRIIHPAIDPLTRKNGEMSDSEIDAIIKSAGIPGDKPLITQVSRMDKWKDPEGVLAVYEKVRKKVDCRLLYCYNLASDDPEGMEIYTRIYNKAKDLVDRGDVIFIIGNNEHLVNAIQRFSSVIIQKSIREGFCLCVTESMWKARPVVASRIGGIPIQIEDEKNGFLLDPDDTAGFADRIIEILKSKKLAKKIGANARQTVQKKFLNTRLMSDYLDLIHELTA